MSSTQGRVGKTKAQAPVRAAEIVREYGPFAGADHIHGVTHDGRRVWAATGSKLVAFDPESGQLARTLDRTGDAGTAFDGTHLYQIAEARIDKIDPATGDVVASIPAPGHGRDSGLAWAEGSLWVGQYRDRKIHQIDPETGAILRTIESNRFVTGVTWVDGELWHGTWEGDESDIRRIDPESAPCSSGWRCRAAPASAGSSPTGQTFSIAAAGRRARSAPCDVRKERNDERPKPTTRREYDDRAQDWNA
jgi:glutamine cyclotransferase